MIVPFWSNVGTSGQTWGLLNGHGTPEDPSPSVIGVAGTCVATHFPHSSVVTANEAQSSVVTIFSAQSSVVAASTRQSSVEVSSWPE